MRSTPPLRVRALLLALLLVVAGGVLAVAAPAAAADKPTRADRKEAAAASAPATSLQAVLEALGRLRVRAVEPEVERAPEPRPRKPQPAPKRQPAPPPAEESCVEAGDSNDVPRVVADIFRCRLAEAGVAEAEARRIAVEAVVVSHCESKWDPDAVVFGGRYVDSPHPYTGNRYSAAGVFQFIRRVADQWVDGGYAQVSNPRRNIDAAARLFIHNRARGFGGWGDWACAAVNDGFKVGSVLPGWPGGPRELPEWARAYVT